MRVRVVVAASSDRALGGKPHDTTSRHSEATSPHHERANPQREHPPRPPRPAVAPRPASLAPGASTAGPAPPRSAIPRGERHQREILLRKCSRGAQRAAEMAAARATERGERRAVRGAGPRAAAWSHRAVLALQRPTAHGSSPFLAAAQSGSLETSHCSRGGMPISDTTTNAQRAPEAVL